VNRRSLLAAAGAVAGSTAGCLGFSLEQQATRTPPLVEDRPDAVYYPTHVEGMEMVGMRSSGGYKCALTYTYPHRFWLVTGTRTKKVTIEDSDSVHLMPIVWDAETGTVPPDMNPQLRIADAGGEAVDQLAPWPMLSQPMGFHFGDNVALGGEGTYTVEASVGDPSIRRTGALAGADGGETFTFEFEFERSKLEEIAYEDISSAKEGTTGALPPMEMPKLPNTQVPASGDLPGTVRGSASSGDAAFVVTTLPDATRFGGGESETYLAVSPRTPYNRYVLPLLSLSGTLVRGGETVFDGPLAATLDPDLGHHYGAAVSGVESGDDLTLTVGAPPQAARHEGYETAFVDMPAMDLTL
jgi:hypothetical protein